MTVKERVKNFFLPPAGSPRWLWIPPLFVLAVLALAVLGGGTYAWDYTNSPQFCGTSCHTMPPQDATYKVSQHANVYCTECHIGRAFVGQQFARKSEDVREIYAMVFNTYEFPIRATRSRPARETCEKCHRPEAFSGDRLRAITHFGNDPANTPSTTYLILKTGGGAKREGLGKGIHWHIVNRVEYFSTDEASQNIPYVRVYNDDGSITEYVDVESGFNKADVKEDALKEVNCITCHNRVSHNFKAPSQSVDEAMSTGLINPAIPEIHRRAVDVLTTPYASRDQAMQVIASLEESYKSGDYYVGHEAEVQAAIQVIRDIYDRTVFPNQKVDWNTHPNNVGHINSPGCFRCHDGKHLNEKQEAVRLECNICHSIPVVAGSDDFLARIEISRGPEPSSHRSPNWITLHNRLMDATCSNCHTTEDPGGTSDTSFCSNSACHGNVFTYAGFNAPKLREILQAQLPSPTPEPTIAPLTGEATYQANIQPVLEAKCVACHGDSASGGLNLTSFANLMKGGKSGAVILPGDSANSVLVKIQSGQHFANLSAEQLELFKQWIDSGALEK